MKKSDLKDYMVVESVGGSLRMVIGNRLIGKKGCLPLDMFDDELKTEEIYKVITINKVYEINKEECICIDDLLNIDKLNLIWQREKEIAWSKVSRGTKVQVRNSEKGEWINRYFRYFSSITIGKYGETQDFYWTVTHLKDEFTGEGEQGCGGYKYCRIHPDVEIREEWYK